MSVYSLHRNKHATRGPAYSEDEKEIVRRVYAEHDGRNTAAAEVAELLPHRPGKSIKDIAYRLGVVALVPDRAEVGPKPKSHHRLTRPQKGRQDPVLMALAEAPRSCPDCGGTLALNRREGHLSCWLCGWDMYVRGDG